MKKKINIQLMTIAVISIVTTLLMAVGISRDLFWNQIFEDLKTYTRLICYTGILEDTPRLKEKFFQEDLRITLIDREGKVVFESYTDASRMENHKDRPEVQEAFSMGEGMAVRKSSTIRKSSFYYALRMEDGKVIRVSQEADSMWKIFSDALPVMGITLAILIFLCLLVSRFLTASLLKPIKQIAENMDKLGEPNTYEELTPFIATIQKQHEDILKNAGMRQEFTANVSHELKTPLTSISGYSELIENGMATSEDVVRFAREIHRNSNRLLTLINDVIRLSELDTAEREETFETIDLYEIAATCVDMLQINAEKNQVTLELRGSSCLVRSEKQMLEELVYNLCDNAIRYNNKDGRVVVTVQIQGGKTVLIVEDTGIGIPKEHQERIFERFYRVDKSRSKSTGGTGLGLAIVKHIVARNHARISLESRVGEGTRIMVVFEGEG
ncbi:MAG: two-component sensor histidine kinase [Lachnospiraceae bacterium]|nr:two-component sensor histidine kinase [Lachnospiraceae bacterium]